MSGGIGRASLLLAGGTLVSRLLGFVKVIVLAGAIGQATSAAGDAFAVANQLPNNIFALIAGGMLSAVLVPQIVKASRDDDGGEGYINRLVTIGVVVFFVLTAIAVIAAPLLVALFTGSSEENAEARALTLAFAYWCLPQVFFYALYSLLGEVLNARRVFGPFTWAPVINNVVGMAGIVIFVVAFGGADRNSDVAVWTPGMIALLGGVTTLGVVAQAAFLAAFWRRAGLRFRPDFRWRLIDFRETGRAAGWMFGMVIASQVAAVVQSSTVFAAVGEGAANVTLQNSWLLFMLPHSVVAVSLITVYFTRMSGHASNGDIDALRTDVSQALRTILLVIVFASVALMVVALPFARVFEDEFANAQAMAGVLFAYLPGLIGFSTLAVLQRVLYALGKHHLAFVLQLTQVTVFIVLALLVADAPEDRLGAYVALSTTVAGTVQALLAVLVVRHLLGGMGGRALLRRLSVSLAAAAVAGGAGLGLVVAFGGYRADGWAQSGIPQALLTISLAAGAMALVYAVCLIVVRDPEFGVLARTVTSRLRRR